MVNNAHRCDLVAHLERRGGRGFGNLFNHPTRSYQGVNPGCASPEGRISSDSHEIVAGKATDQDAESADPGAGVGKDGKGSRFKTEGHQIH